MQFSKNFHTLHSPIQSLKIPMPKNQNLHKAKKEKNDEFYTQLIDIERELQHYTTHLNGKTIYCNCDSPNSQFVHFFKENFHTLKLKKLIATSYNPNGQGTYLEYDGKETLMENLIGSGDFRSVECSNLLKQADIVITNPPFSLFREFIAQLEVFNKHFIIIGNQNAITYKEIFKLIKENKLWLGASIHSGDREFRVPPTYPLMSSGFRTDSDGNNFIRVKGVRWFTNIDYPERYKLLTLTKTYNPIDYPKYDNYDAIEVSKTKDIPKDYTGIMGVPITFLDKYNPQQFDIIGLSASAGYNQDIVGIPFLGEKDARPLINGKIIYARIIIKHKQIT